jgi:allophanate hydrolase subunit 1
VLSAEKCSKLCSILPAYERLLLKLKEYQQKYQDISNVLEKGIEKLIEYQQETDNV